MSYNPPKQISPDQKAGKQPCFEGSTKLLCGSTCLESPGSEYSWVFALAEGKKMSVARKSEMFVPCLVGFSSDVFSGLLFL